MIFTVAHNIFQVFSNAWSIIEFDCTGPWQVFILLGLLLYPLILLDFSGGSSTRDIESQCYLIRLLILVAVILCSMTVGELIGLDILTDRLGPITR